MIKFSLIAFILISFLGNAQFTKVMDFPSGLVPESGFYTNDYNTWNGKLFFVDLLSDGTSNINVTDGTAEGTIILKNVPKPTGSNSINVYSIKKSGNGVFFKFLFFNSITSSQSDELWFSDGTAANTVKLATNAQINICGLMTNYAVQNFQRPYQASHVGNTFYFWKGADNLYNTDLFLWKSDGTVSGTQQVTSAVRIPYDPNYGDEYMDLGLEYNGNYYFLAQDATSTLYKNKLYKLDNGNPQILANFSSVIRMGTVFKNKIYFIATKIFNPAFGYNEREIFQSDGTVAGTTVFKNFNGDNSWNGVDEIEHFTFQKTTDYMFIRHKDNLLHNIVVTDGNPNNLYPIYTGSVYPVTNFYLDDRMAYFLRQSTDTNTYNSFSVRMSDLVKTTITKPFYNTTAGTIQNGTLWVSNKPTYNAAVYTPWRSTGSDATTVATNGYNYSTNFLVLNGTFYGFSSYLGFLYNSLYRFDPNFTFNNLTADNSWGTANNWQSKMIPLDFDNAIIPASFSPQINADAFANNITLNSPLNISAGSLNIAGNLDLGSKITLNNNSLNLKGGTSAINNGNSTNYIITNGTGTVNVENLNTARGTVNLPIGTANNYNPVSISNTGTSDTFSARVSEGNTSTNPNINATWEISEGTAGGSSVNLSLGWNQSQENAGFSRNSAKVGHYLNGSWTEENSGSVSGSNPYTISATGISSFSPFSVMNFGALAAIDSSKSKIQVYPNPFNDQLNILTAESGVVNFYDLGGKLVSTSILVKGQNSFNKSTLPKGVYIYQVKNTNGEAVSSGKVIKK